MGFKKKDSEEETIDTSDFTKLVDVLGSDVFGRKLWERLVEQTEILINDKEGMSLDCINGILAKYAKHHSWLIVEQERFNEMVDLTELAFDQWNKLKYAEASRSVAKNTAANIEARIVELCAEELQTTRETLETENYSTEEINEKLKYQGWGGRKTYIIELRTKTNMIKGFVKVWDKEVNALQTLSKNITADMELIKRHLE